MNCFANKSVTRLVAVFGLVAAGIQTWFLHCSNGIAARSANAAKQSVDLARDTAQKQLRAYVLASEGRVSGLEGNGPMKVKVTLGNFGQTPAESVTVSMREEWRDGRPPVPAEPGAMLIQDGEQAALAPGEKLYIEHEITPFRQELRQGKATLHATGIVRYVDVFGASHEAAFHFVQGGKYDPRSPLMGVAE